MTTCYDVPDADDLFRQAIYEEVMECCDDPRINAGDELRRLATMLETTFWMIWNESGPGAEPDEDDDEDEDDAGYAVGAPGGVPENI